MKNRLLLVNAGNTNTVTATFDGGRVRQVRTGATSDGSAQQVQAVVNEACRHGSVRSLVIAAMVPRADARWARAAARAHVPLFRVHGRLDPGFPVTYPRRATLGADRVANSCAAVNRLGAPVIVIDVGTATTFDVITRDRGFIGGVIAPGPSMMLDALSERTALLPRVSKLRSGLPSLGRSTAGAMRIGAQVGFTGLVREILSRLRALPGLDTAPVCLTGGAARAAAPAVGNPVRIIPRLTLEGMAQLYFLNQ